MVTKNIMTTSIATRTRSGRISKPPERYEPKEEVIDDYSDESEDEESDDDEEDDDEESDDEEEDDDEEDGDEEGNLKGFITYDSEEEA